MRKPPTCWWPAAPSSARPTRWATASPRCGRPRHGGWATPPLREAVRWGSPRLDELIAEERTSDECDRRRRPAAGLPGDAALVHLRGLVAERPVVSDRLGADRVDHWHAARPDHDQPAAD